MRLHRGPVQLLQQRQDRGSLQRAPDPRRGVLRRPRQGRRHPPVRGLAHHF